MGLYDYNARYYDPYIGRFIQADSIIPDPGSAQGYNRYSYVNNNPLRYNDPSGHYYCDDHYDPACLETAEERKAFARMTRSGGIPSKSMPKPKSTPMPMLSYDGRAAAQYGLDWRDGINSPRYAAMSNGSDCTNFVSQCLVAGGLVPDGRWYYDGQKSPAAWIYTLADPSIVGQEGDYGRTLDGLYNYLTDAEGLGISNISEHNQVPHKSSMSFDSTDPTHPGDVAFYYQDGIWGHAAIVVGWGPQDPGGLDDFLTTNNGEFADHNQGGGLTPWIAEHSGAIGNFNPRPIQYTGSAVGKIKIVHIPSNF